MASGSLNTFGLKIRRPSDTFKDVNGFSRYRAMKGNVRIPDLRYTPRWSTIDIVIDTSNFSYESLKPKDRLLNDYKSVAKKALTSTITDLEIMGNLPILLQNKGKRLKRFFNREQIRFIKKVSEKYKLLPQEFTWGKVPRETIANLKHIQAIREPKGEPIIIAPVMSKLVEIMTDNYCLSVQRNQAKDFLIKEIDVLLGLMRDLEEIMDYNFNMTAAEERKNRIIYNSAVKQYNSLKEEFQNLSTSIEEKRGTFVIAINNERKKIQDLIQEKDNLEKKTKEDIAQYVTNSEVSMMDDSLESHENQSQLAKSASLVTTEYETLRKNNLKREEGLKKKCSKVETLLANWLNLYDTDVGKKRLEYEELKDKLDGLIEDYNNWNAALDEQQALYDECFGEFEEEEREKFEEMAYQFLRNRSAARIQRYYREYRKKKKEKQKHRKGGKKDKKKPAKKSASVIQSKQRRKKQELERELMGKNKLLEECIRLKNYLQNKYNKMLLDLRYYIKLLSYYYYLTMLLYDINLSKENNHELKQSIALLNKQYNSLLNKNLLREKKIKDKLGRIEAQLASWISKYDADIGEKRLELDGLKNHFHDICLDTEDMENRLDDIDTFYRLFKAEEGFEERQKLEEIARHFLRNKAASKIQKYWYEYRRMKSSHRKDGKRKKNQKGQRQ